MSLAISVTDQVCSHHKLPYHLLVRFDSVGSCLWFFWPDTLKGADTLPCPYGME